MGDITAANHRQKSAKTSRARHLSWLGRRKKDCASLLLSSFSVASYSGGRLQTLKINNSAIIRAKEFLIFLLLEISVDFAGVREIFLTHFFWPEPCLYIGDMTAAYKISIFK